MTLASFFEGECKWCNDRFRIATGSADECNRCRTVITLLEPLSILEIEKLLNACRDDEIKKVGRWQIKWKTR